MVSHKKEEIKRKSWKERAFNEVKWNSFFRGVIVEDQKRVFFSFCGSFSLIGSHKSITNELVHCRRKIVYVKCDSNCLKLLEFQRRYTPLSNYMLRFLRFISDMGVVKRHLRSFRYLMTKHTHAERRHHWLSLKEKSFASYRTYKPLWDTFSSRVGMACRTSSDLQWGCTFAYHGNTASQSLWRNLPSNLNEKKIEYRKSFMKLAKLFFECCWTANWFIKHTVFSHSTFKVSPKKQ